MIYNITKISFSTQRSIYSEKEFLKKISNLYGFIYLNTNIKNEKVYVGKCELPKTIENRWAEHKNEGRKLKEWQDSEERWSGDAKPLSVKDTYFNRAIAKYGPNAWTLNLIDIAYSNPELIDEEIFWIKMKDSMNPKKGYNMQNGGLGGKHCPETIKKLEKISKKRWQDSDFQEKMSEVHKEVWQRPEYQKKMSEIRKNTAQNPEFQKRHSEILKEVWQRPGYQEKMSEVHKNVWRRSGYQEKMSEIHKKTGQNPEFQEKMSKVHKEVW